MPPTHRTGSPSELVPHFQCRKQYRKAPALIALPAAPGLLLGPATGPEVCSPLPASPYSFVLGSKLFPARLTVAPLLGRLPGPGFAPPSLLALILPSKGANFFLPSSLWRPSWAGSRAQSLLPTPLLALIPSSWGANFFLPSSLWRPFWAGSQARVCSPLPSSPYSSVQGSKLFPARCRPLGPGFASHSLLALIPPSKGANFFLPSSLWRPFWAGFLLFSVPRFALENRFHWLCGYPGANRAAGRADFK